MPAPAEVAPAPTQLNAVDMTLLNGVRQAGVWVIPLGRWPRRRGNTVKVRQVGQMIADRHRQLDQLVVDTTHRLGANDPVHAHDPAQGFLTSCTTSKGVQFYQTFVTLPLGAYSKIFPVIRAVRASICSTVVRKLADQAYGAR